MRTSLITEHHKNKIRLCYSIVRTGSKQHSDGSRWQKGTKLSGSAVPRLCSLKQRPSLYNRQNGNFSALLIGINSRLGLWASSKCVSPLSYGYGSLPRWPQMVSAATFPMHVQEDARTQTLARQWTHYIPKQNGFPLFNHQATLPPRKTDVLTEFSLGYM